MKPALIGVVIVALVGASAVCGTNACAQSRERTAQAVRDSTRAADTVVRPLPKPLSKQGMRLLSALDVWIVERFRNAGLLPDSTAASAADNRSATLARIESARAGNSTDTLFALHFAPHPTDGAFVTGQAVRLAGPTGTIAPLAGIVLARRAFSAPRVPAANGNVARGDAANDALWRYGWAYLVALPKAGLSTPPATFRGWLLLDGSTPK